MAVAPAIPRPGLSDHPWLQAVVDVGPPQIFGTSHGYERRCIPFLGGTISGRVSGMILPGGTDWQRIYPDGTTELDAHYAIGTADGVTIEAHGTGLRAGSEIAM